MALNPPSANAWWIFFVPAPISGFHRMGIFQFDGPYYPVAIRSQYLYGGYFFVSTTGYFPCLTSLTKKWKDDSMSELHKGSENNEINVEFKEGERGPLCSNKAIVRSPSLEFSSNNFESEDATLEYLASILVQAYFDHKEHERIKSSNKKEGSNLLSSINEGTS